MRDVTPIPKYVYYVTAYPILIEKNWTMNEVLQLLHNERVSCLVTGCHRSIASYTVREGT